MQTAPPQPVGVSERHTTVPAPSTLQPDPAGRAHLIVAAPGGRPVADLVASLAGPVEVLVRCDDAPGELEAALRARLSGASVGLRLYIAGSEGLVRRVTALALEAGMERDEIHSEVTASAARPVWCTHCKTVTPDVATTLVRCAGCGRTLEVYHHFSRRHGAYMGFQADAELPGDLPEAQTRWP